MNVPVLAFVWLCAFAAIGACTVGFFVFLLMWDESWEDQT